MEYEKVEELLEREGYTIERMAEDGNCLFRAATRQLLGDEKRYPEIRHETVEYIIANRSFYSDYEVDIEERLFEQLMNRSWGGHMEIDAIARRYNVGIMGVIKGRTTCNSYQQTSAHGIEIPAKPVPCEA